MQVRKPLRAANVLISGKVFAQLLSPGLKVGSLASQDNERPLKALPLRTSIPMWGVDYLTIKSETIAPITIYRNAN